MEQEQVEFDLIDEAFYSLLSELSGDDDEAFEDNAEFLYDLIEELVDAEKISEIPDSEDSDEEKKAWIEVSIPLIKENLKGENVDTNS